MLKNWAQDHDHGYQIADPDPTDQGVENSGQFLSWIIKQGHSNLDLLGLLERLDLFMQSRKKSSQDGMKCKHCNDFYSFAEPNQDDGTLICYSCRQNPYIK